MEKIFQFEWFLKNVGISDRWKKTKLPVFIEFRKLALKLFLKYFWSFTELIEFFCLSKAEALEV